MIGTVAEPPKEHSLPLDVLLYAVHLLDLFQHSSASYCDLNSQMMTKTEDEITHYFIFHSHLTH